MSITVVTPTVPRKDRSGRTPFVKFFTSDDLSTCEEIMALPSGASKIYIESVMIGSCDQLTVTLGDGETSNAVTAAVLGPIELNTEVGTAANEQVAATIFDKKFIRELAVSVSLTIDASGAGTVWGVIEGYSA